MEIVVAVLFGIAFLGAYALVLPFRKDYNKMLDMLEKQNKARVRYY